MTFSCSLCVLPNCDEYIVVSIPQLESTSAHPPLLIEATLMSLRLQDWYYSRRAVFPSRLLRSSAWSCIVIHTGVEFWMGEEFGGWSMLIVLLTDGVVSEASICVRRSY